MLSINTKQNTKLVEIDGFAYRVRRPGAGEALTMQKSGRTIAYLSKLDNRTDAQSEQLQELGIKVLSISLALFKSEDPKATDYIQTLGVEILIDVIDQVFNDAPETS